MTTRIQFWREVNVNGTSGHSIVRSFIVPEGIPDSQALEAAKHEFCQALGVCEWSERAHGFDVQCYTDDRRSGQRQLEGSEYWIARIGDDNASRASPSLPH